MSRSSSAESVVVVLVVVLRLGVGIRVDVGFGRGVGGLLGRSHALPLSAVTAGPLGPRSQFGARLFSRRSLMAGQLRASDMLA